MSRYVIGADTLTEIAQAIRVKRGLTEKLAPTDMPEEIREIGDGIIPAGIRAISENGIFDVTEVAQVDVNVEQAKTDGISVTFAGWRAGTEFSFQLTATQSHITAGMKQEE